MSEGTEEEEEDEEESNKRLRRKNIISMIFHRVSNVFVEPFQKFQPNHAHLNNSKYIYVSIHMRPRLAPDFI